MILDEAQDINLVMEAFQIVSQIKRRIRFNSDQNLEWNHGLLCWRQTQSIYLFRQASVSTFHRFADHLRRINNHELSTLDIFKEPNP